MLVRRLFLASSAGLAAPGLPARAQTRASTRPMRLVVPMLPGGGNDLLARSLAEIMAPILNRTIVVDNRAGAAGNIASEYVARAEKDGDTFMLAQAPIYVANKFLYGRLMSIDPLRDLAPVSRVATGTTALMVRADSPFRTINDLLSAAKASPGKLTLGSSGTGTASHFSLELLKQAAGVEIMHVPYRGGMAAYQDLLGGSVDMCFDVTGGLIPSIRDGLIRILAVASALRLQTPEFAGVPTLQEVLPGSGIDFEIWYGVNATGGSPREKIEQLHHAVTTAARNTAFVERLAGIGLTSVVDASPDAYGTFMAGQAQMWKTLITTSGVSLE